MAASKKNEVIEIPAMNLKMLTLSIKGTSPLIVHAWSHKAKQMMLDKQMKKATKGKDARDPFEEYLDAFYWITERPDGLTPENFDELTKDTKFGFPALAFKAAAIDGAYQQGVISKKTTARGAFHVIGDMAVIEGKPHMRSDMVRIGMGVAEQRFRPEFTEWSTTLTIQYNATAISASQLVNLFNVGGFSVGVGEHRPAKDGDNGTFTVC